MTQVLVVLQNHYHKLSSQSPLLRTHLLLSRIVCLYLNISLLPHFRFVVSLNIISILLCWRSYCLHMIASHGLSFHSISKSCVIAVLYLQTVDCHWKLRPLICVSPDTACHWINLKPSYSRSNLC